MCTPQVNAIDVGINTGRELLNDQDCAGVASCASANQFNAWLLMAFGAIRVATFTVIYNGLLSIGATLDNPLGNDPADLPGLAYQVYMKDESEAFATGVDAIDTRDGWWAGLGEGRAAGRQE